MHKAVLTLALVVLVLASSLVNSQYLLPHADAQEVAYYLKIDGVPGDTKNTERKDWIDIETFNFGMTAPSSSGNIAQKTKFGDLSLTKPFGKTALLLIDSAMGKHYPKAQIVVVKSGTEIIKWTLGDVSISSYQIIGEQNSLKEQMSISFTKIEVVYTASGGPPVKMGWDIKANKRI